MDTDFNRLIWKKIFQLLRHKDIYQNGMSFFRNTLTLSLDETVVLNLKVLMDIFCIVSRTQFLGQSRDKKNFDGVIK